MFDCPYCHQVFTTKQRLISHLSRNNKCYDVTVIGVPPILLELMGFNQDKKDETVIPEPIKEKPIEMTNENTDIKYICVKCQKTFVSQKNLDKHMSSIKCHKKGTVIENNELPIIFKSKAENKKQVKPPTPPKPPKNEDIPKTKEYQYPQQNIKYIMKENYVTSLTEIMGSQEMAFNFIRTCIQTKIRGGINLLYKVYFEGKEYKDYPIEIVDAKTRKIYYKTPDKIELDENAVRIKAILIDNLRNCYLQFCNHIISTNLENTDVIFNDYDLADIQNHILELADEKKKDRIISGLIDQTKK